MVQYDRFKYDGKHGIYLKTPYGSATYLPVVKTLKILDWSIDEYMMHLSDKAADNINAWKEAVSVIKIYRSIYLHMIKIQINYYYISI